MYDFVFFFQKFGAEAPNFWKKNLLRGDEIIFSAERSFRA